MTACYDWDWGYMLSGDTAPDEQGCTILVFGTPASGKSSLISRLSDVWLRSAGSLDVSVVSDNGLLKSLELGGVITSFSGSREDREIRLTPQMRRSVAAVTARDVAAESVCGRIAVLELATFEWQTVRDNLRLPGGRRSYAIYLSCNRDVSLQRQHDRAQAGVFNAVLPADVMDQFMQQQPPRGWFVSELSSYWEFDTGMVTIEEILAALDELVRYRAKRLWHLYDSR